MSYTKPQMLVFQEFRQVPAVITGPLRAHISGPQAKLHRYAVAGEKTTIALGEYDSLSDTDYAWPGKSAGSKVDQDYTKLFIDDALLLYFQDLVGAGSSVAPVSDYANRVRSSSVSFKDNGDYDRDAALLRDVQLGDTVYVRGSVGSDSFDLWTYVRGFKGDAVAAEIGTATVATSNAAAQSIATSIDKISGADNNIQLTAYATGYNGLKDGNIDETYTVEVISGSTNGDLTTARLRITSASGNDDVSSKAPAGAGGETEIGTRGLLVEFDQNKTTSGSSAAEGDDVAPNDLIPGQKWKVRVVQTYVRPTATSSGTYTGTWDTTYIAEVTRGGGYGTDPLPQITVSTTTGVDVSGPTSVSGAATAIAIGSEGVLLSWSGGSGLCKGDKWEITVTAEAEGPIRTLILGHDLSDDLLAAIDLDLELYIKKNIQISQNRAGFAPLTNWETSSTALTVSSGIVAYDTSWVDGDGDEVALDVKGGTLYAEYREWVSDYTGVIESLSDAGDVEATLGVVHPDNPLAMGVFKALQNSGGAVVKFTGVSDPTLTSSWSEVLDLLGGRDDVYNLTPMTYDRTVQDLFAAHVANQSSPEAGLWRGCFLNLQAKTVDAVVSAASSDDEDVVLAKLSDDPDTTGTQYTYLQITSGNAELLEMGVKAGDVVRFLYTTDGFGTEIYSEFPIEEVVGETSLRLTLGHTVAITTPQKVEIWRNLKKSEIAAEVGSRAGSFASRRVCVIWPDTVSSGGVSMPGYFLCAALAGLRSGVVPHQGLTNVEISGFDDITRTTEFFNNSNLDTMAEDGMWIVTQSLDGVVYSRHAVTTDMSDVNHREEMVRSNLDSISYLFLNSLKPFIGRSNVTPSALTVLRTQLDAAVEYLKSNGFTETLGAQLIDGVITQIRPHALLKDRVVAAVSLTLPVPINNLELHLVV